MKRILLALALGLGVSSAHSFELFKDYSLSKEIYNVTFVKVNPNRINDYLEGLQQTWKTSCDVQKELKTVTSCNIYVNTLNAQSPWNVMLVVIAPSAAVSDPDKAGYDEFVAKWQAKLAEDKRNKLVTGYEDFREFVNEANVRRVDFID